MLELISIIASLVLCVLIPIEVNKIRNGWVRPKFTGGRSKFLAAYRRAHPRRLALVHTVQRTRIVSLAVPDLGDGKRNRAVDALIADFVRRLRKFIDDIE